MLRLALSALIALAAAAPVRAEGEGRGDAGPVVVELFTSQGCSACPSADRILAHLAEREDVLPLALHVDYWDYIGWEDAFADRAHTMRQKAYAHAVGERMIYTPQMVVQGEERVVGTRPHALRRAIGQEADRSGTVDLDASRHGGAVRVEARAAGPFEPPLAVQLVRYAPNRTVAITRGENAGHTFSYANVVTAWDRVGSWDGRTPLSLTLDAPGDDLAAVILQEPGPGPIHAAARAD